MSNITLIEPEFDEREQIDIDNALNNPVVRKYLEARLLETLVDIQGTPMPTSSINQHEILVNDLIMCKGAMSFFNAIYQGD